MLESSLERIGFQVHHKHIESERCYGLLVFKIILGTFLSLARKSSFKEHFQPIQTIEDFPSIL